MFSFSNMFLQSSSIIKHNYVLTVCMCFHILYKYALPIHTKLQIIIMK